MLFVFECLTLHHLLYVTHLNFLLWVFIWWFFGSFLLFLNHEFVVYSVVEFTVIVILILPVNLSHLVTEYKHIPLINDVVSHFTSKGLELWKRRVEWTQHDTFLTHVFVVWVDAGVQTVFSELVSELIHCVAVVPMMIVKRVFHCNTFLLLIWKDVNVLRNLIHPWMCEDLLWW